MLAPAVRLLALGEAFFPAIVHEARIKPVVLGPFDLGVYSAARTLDGPPDEPG